MNAKGAIGIRPWVVDEEEFTDEVRREMEEAQQEMGRGEYATHEEVMTEYKLRR